MARPTSGEFLRIIVDPIRLGVLGAAVEGPVEVDDLATRLGVTRRELLEAVGRLRSVGLITEGLELDRAELAAIAAALPKPALAADEVTAGSWSADEAEVLGRFFSGTRLTDIPTQRAKRVIVLDRLAQEFEPGLRYDEREVNVVLQMFHADYAALRRYLVDEGFLTRADGVYWRTGGRYPA